ncbi:ABC transporter permease [Cellulomonas sp. HZM]|uniref:ABC transporter permease n=1 Tax=Cellulomonas sp. HZM TaxID=1454010 RepID=UPI0004934DD3|nr:ABC transporter permease [Cellulomonas sp. HZM]
MSARALPAGQAIRLVAGREISTRVRSKGFLWVTAAFVAVIVLGGLVLKLTSSTSSPSTVGLTGSAAGSGAQVVAAAKAVGVDVTTKDVADEATGREQLEHGDLDALVTSTDPRLTVVVHSKVDDDVSAVFGSLAQQLELSRAITELGGDPSAVAQQVATASPDIVVISPEPKRDGGQIVAGIAVGILLFISLMNAGQLVAQGVVEEKTSRVVELLLATLRPWQLMAGKVLGIGAVGLLQLVVVVGAAAITALSIGVLDTSSLDIGAVAVWALVWFVLGFLTFSLLLAGLASLVSRQEDIGSVTGPVITAMVVPYVVGISIAPYAPDNPVVRVLSIVPFASPFVMPIRQALGAAEPWEVALSLGLAVAVIPLLVWLAGRIYSNAVMRVGGRVKLSDALSRS